MVKKKLFISYSRDDLNFVTRLVKGLRDKGETVWFDSHIRSGEQWDSTIEREIGNADVIILVLSDTSVSSGNVMDEVSLAKDLGKVIIPIKIKECKIPMRLRRYQYVDFTEDTQWGFNRLLDDINQTERPKHVRRPKPRKKVAAKKTSLLVPFLVGGLLFLGLFMALAVWTAWDDYDEYDNTYYPANTNTLDENITPVNNTKTFSKTGMVIYQNQMGIVVVNKLEGGYPQIGDILYALTPLEVYTTDRYATGDWVPEGGEVKVTQIYPMTSDGFVFMSVEYN